MLKSLGVCYLLFGTLVLLALAGCNEANTSGGATDTVEAYLGALIEKDVNMMINLSCAAWEADARLEFDSFAAVEVKLEGPDCQVSAQDGDTALVSCTGKIIASYGAEDLEIELEDRTFQVIEENGEWRMCGYH